MKMHNPPHPGEVLFGLYIEPMDISITKTAESLGMTRTALSEIIHGKRSISAKVAIKLGKAFSCNPQTWLKMQAKYDLWQEQQNYSASEIPVLYECSEEAV